MTTEYDIKTTKMPLGVTINKILFWIVFVIGVIFAVWYIVGDSPTLEQSLLILILIFLFKNQGVTRENKMRLRYIGKRLNSLEENFHRISEDLEHIKHK